MSSNRRNSNSATKAGIGRKRPRSASSEPKPNTKKALAEAYAGFKDFLDPATISAKSVTTEAEKACLLQIAKDINKKLPGGDLEKRKDTWTTLTLWKDALPTDEGLTDNVKTKTAVQKFLIKAFDVYRLPEREDGRLALVQNVLKFVGASLFRGTLAGHIQNRLAEKRLKAATAQFGCPILCLPHRVPTFAAQKHVVRERDRSSEGDDGESDVGRAVADILASFQDDGPGRSSPFPLVIGGESGSGKTFFSALAPEYICEGYGLDPDAMKSKALTVYACPTDTEGSVSRQLRDAVRETNAALQDAKERDGGEHLELRAARTEAAAKFLEALVLHTLDWKGTLELPDDGKYECLFIVVDELSTAPELLRALLVLGDLQKMLLKFTKGFAEKAHIICCTTGSQSFVRKSGTHPGEYVACVMTPSPTLFEALVQKDGATADDVAALKNDDVIWAGVQNRRVGAFMARKMRKYKKESTKGGLLIQVNDTNGRLIDASRVELYLLLRDAMKDYRGKNGLKLHTPRAAEAVIAEGLRHLLLWSSRDGGEAERLFAAMGEANPLKLGIFTVDVKECDVIDEKPMSEEVKVSVTATQLLMAAVRYGAARSAFTGGPDAFEQLSAVMFNLFLEATRVVDKFTQDESTREDCIRAGRDAKNKKAVDDLVKALRGEDRVEYVSVRTLLGALDPVWEQMHTTGNRVEDAAPHDLSTTILKHKRNAEKLQAVGIVDPVHVVTTVSEIERMRAASAGETAFTMVNAPRASYADFICVSGEILFLAQCKRCDTGFGTDAEVTKELTKLGFRCGRGKKPKSSYNFTKKLMKDLKCTLAVPLFFVSKPVDNDAKGRAVIAHGHGWSGPVPFVCLAHGMSRTYKREKQ